MAAKVSYLKVKSSDNEHTFIMTIWTPEIRPKGVVQIVHGMREHVGRYQDFAKFLTSKGFIVCGHDHIGHGKSALYYGSYGYFGKKNGARTLVNDTVGVTKYLAKTYPDLKIFMLGHSMGSFIARIAAVKVSGLISGIVATGTGGASSLSPFARVLTESLSRISGPAKNNYFADRAFEAFVGRKLLKTDKKDAWISRDPEVVYEFEQDPLTQFYFTNQGYSDLIDLQVGCNSKIWYENFDKNLPILLLSGTKDPIGSFGLDVPRIAKGLRECGVRDVQYRLYPGARHELLNEINRIEIYKYILNWINLYI